MWLKRWANLPRCLMKEPKEELLHFTANLASSLEFYQYSVTYPWYRSIAFAEPIDQSSLPWLVVYLALPVNLLDIYYTEQSVLDFVLYTRWVIQLASTYPSEFVEYFYQSLTSTSAKFQIWAVTRQASASRLKVNHQTLDQSNARLSVKWHYY